MCNNHTDKITVKLFMLKLIRSILCAACMLASIAHAQTEVKVVPVKKVVAVQGLDGLGQTVQIHTRLHSFVGKPIWTLIIRDLDHGQNIPYVFDFTRGDQYWVALTYGRNYLITASRLQIETPRSRFNMFKNYRISNFCNIESMGRIIRGKSMMIQLQGDLSPDSNTYSCNVTYYPEGASFIKNP